MQRADHTERQGGLLRQVSGDLPALVLARLLLETMFLTVFLLTILLYAILPLEEVLLYLHLSVCKCWFIANKPERPLD